MCHLHMHITNANMSYTLDSVAPEPWGQTGMCTYRVEVRDLSGDIHSVLFYPEAGTFTFDFGELTAGVCIRVRVNMCVCVALGVVRSSNLHGAGVHLHVVEVVD